MTKHELIRDLLSHKANLILRKFKDVNKTRELTNYETKITLYRYGAGDIKPHDPEDERNIEILNERMSRLKKDEMEAVTLIFFKSLTYREAAKEMKCSSGRVQWLIKTAIKVLRW